MLKLIRGIRNLKKLAHGCVVTIGNFDGMHLGHQVLIEKLNAKAHLLSVPSVVIIFEPQPNEFFAHKKVPARLMRLREKLMALNQANADIVLCLNFNQALADLSAQDFVKTILVDQLGVQYLLVGDDFKFGHQRRGDIQLLKTMGNQFGFIAENMDTFMVEHERVSSSRVRHALEAGDLKTAKKLLGTHFVLSGHVAHGDKRGRTLGIPTANIYLHRRAVPIHGIFAVEMYGVADVALKGVANVGTRPTVDGTRSLLEVHLLDFNQDIYGKPVFVEFLHKFRNEEKYDSIELLKIQMEKDIQDARVFFQGE